MVVSNDLTIPDYVFLWDTRVPQTHGSVAPAGVADLLVVKQQLVRYEGADVAHIENVLKGERKLREHSRRRETEELTFRETEITTTEERELESTTRFEMSRETSETIKEDAALKAGLTVSGKYGPTVEFSASAEGSVSRSKEEATKSASSFSQDVTERSATKVTERVLERSSLRVTNEVIEKNSHELDNVRWHRPHLGRVPVGQQGLPGPDVQLRHPDDVRLHGAGAGRLPDRGARGRARQRGRAREAGAVHAAAGPDHRVELLPAGSSSTAPPTSRPRRRCTRRSRSTSRPGAERQETDYNHSGQIAIDEGYRAVLGVVGMRPERLGVETRASTSCSERQTHRFSGGLGISVWSTPLERRDRLDAVRAGHRGCTARSRSAVEVKCQRTDRAMIKWRLDTHAKLTTAYKARLAEYEEKLAALEVQAGVAIRGHEPRAEPGAHEG